MNVIRFYPYFWYETPFIHNYLKSYSSFRTTFISAYFLCTFREVTWVSCLRLVKFWAGIFSFRGKLRVFCLFSSINERKLHKILILPLKCWILQIIFEFHGSRVYEKAHKKPALVQIYKISNDMAHVYQSFFSYIVFTLQKI